MRSAYLVFNTSLTGGKKLVEESFIMPKIADQWIEAYYSMSSGNVSSCGKAEGLRMI